MPHCCNADRPIYSRRVHFWVQLYHGPVSHAGILVFSLQLVNIPQGKPGIDVIGIDLDGLQMGSQGFVELPFARYEFPRLVQEGA